MECGFGVLRFWSFGFGSLRDLKNTCGEGEKSTKPKTRYIYKLLF